MPKNKEKSDEDDALESDASESDAPTWLAIPGYYGYEASSDGRVRSVDRVIVRGNGYRLQCAGRVLSPSWDRGGYQRVHLWSGGKRQSRYVHHLVLETFKGPRPSGDHDGHHLNGDREDNTPENLSWLTREDNRREANLRNHRPLAWEMLGGEAAWDAVL